MSEAYVQIFSITVSSLHKKAIPVFMGELLFYMKIV